ncbi:MAG: anaerobic sulfatase maturase [Ruminococcus sp.]|jgi:uncharacterized protein
MPPVNILIKPASSKCNMRCRYCFYHDVASLRETADLGVMKEDTLKKLIKSGIAYGDHLLSFAFQGGEPTLAGLEYFEKVISWQKKFLEESGKKNLRIHNAIQTNGYLIDEKWAQFFHDHHFLVGLSLDGPANVHDKNRVDAAGKGTFSRVMKTAELFDRYHVDYNILTVVTGQNAMAIKRIYRFFMKHNFSYLQFIPCLEPLKEERGKENYSLSVQEYGQFLIDVFDLWFADFKMGKYTSIRHLDNWILLMTGEPPEACNMNGRCSIQFVVEGDGGIYPCDFYVLDEWRLGTVGKQSFEDIMNSERARDFIRESLGVPEACRACQYGFLCRNGCRRDRVPDGNTGVLKNYYCQAIYRFFSEREEELKEAVRILRQRRG